MADEDRQFEFDVAVSFAGESRDYVLSVVRGLDTDSVNVFYDEDRKAEMWGEDLVDFFTDLYQHRARYVVMFVSAAYAEKMWTTLERRSALARAFAERRPYVLPVRLDDTALPGLLPTVAYLDARVEGTQGIIDAIHKKLGAERTAAPTVYAGRVPKTTDELQDLITLRPDHWEWWLYAGTLQLGIGALEDKYLDFEMGYARPTGKSYDGRDAYEFLRTTTTNALALINSFNTVLDADTWIRAFGQPGEPGDPDRIQHLAQRLLDVYEGFLDEAARLLGSSVPDSFRRAQVAAAKYGTDPIEKIRSFVTEFADMASRIPEMTAEHDEDQNGPLSVNMKITIGLDEHVTDEFLEGLREGIESLQADDEDDD
ncbi:MAG: TIR domain-containing protein [Actinomycetota bacterium]|nr:TIR domain-containing protein [Actinomycetota bacterium]